VEAVCAKSRGFRPNLTAEESDCRALAGQVLPVRTKRDQLLDRLRTLPDQLGNKLPEELELKYDAAPRFWMPADPVIVVKNCGCPTKHQFPRPLPCRLPEQIVSASEVVVDRTPKPFTKAAGVAEIAAAAQKHLPACPEVVSGLLDEGSIVEQAITDLAERTLPLDKQFNTADAWQEWVERLTKDLTWDGKPESFPRDQINFGKQGALNIPPHRLAELWGQQPWSPLFLDWQITWFPTPEMSATEDGFGPVWPLRNFDYVPLNSESVPEKGYAVRGRSLLSPIDGRIFKEPIESLRDLLQSKRGGTPQKDGNPAFPKAVADVLSRYEIVWDKTLGELEGAGLMGQALTGFHQALLRRDVTLPHITPDPTRPWIESKKSLESDVTQLLDAPDKEGLTGERLAPPAPPPPTSAPPTFSFSTIRAGALRIDELWLVDDFGQSADLLGLTSARSRSSGQIFHPRMRWHNDQSVVAMPPRVLQPVRLNFRFTEVDGGPKDVPPNVANSVIRSKPRRILPDDGNCEPALTPICGWIFYNPLDQALVLCERDGQLVGNLVIIKEQSGFRINWEAGPGGAALSDVCNPSLKAFAQIETNASNPRLHQLLNLVDRALERIRPAAARRDTVLVGRPLALVNATIGLELFGKAWADPHKPPVTREGVGDPALEALRVHVNLGCLHNVEDGLVGYFKSGDYNRIVPGELPEKLEGTGYIGDPKNYAIRVGFGAPERITMLMDLSPIYLVEKRINDAAQAAPTNQKPLGVASLAGVVSGAEGWSVWARRETSDSSLVILLINDLDQKTGDDLATPIKLAAGAEFTIRIPLNPEANRASLDLLYSYQHGTKEDDPRIDGKIELKPAEATEWTPVVTLTTDQQSPTMIPGGELVKIFWHIEDGVSATLRGPLPGGNSELTLPKPKADFKIDGSLQIRVVSSMTYVLQAQVKCPKDQSILQVVRMLTLDTSNKKYGYVAARTAKVLPYGLIEVDWAAWGVKQVELSVGHTTRVIKLTQQTLGRFFEGMRCDAGQRE
jgi:hypothetical protein